MPHFLEHFLRTGSAQADRPDSNADASVSILTFRYCGIVRARDISLHMFLSK